MKTTEEMTKAWCGTATLEEHREAPNVFMVFSDKREMLGAGLSADEAWSDALATLTLRRDRALGEFYTEGEHD